MIEDPDITGPRRRSNLASPIKTNKTKRVRAIFRICPFTEQLPKIKTNTNTNINTNSIYGGSCKRIFAASRTGFVLLLMLIWMLAAHGLQKNSTEHSLLRLSADINIPVSEMNALYDLYIATNGEDWLWSDNTAVDGVPWNFTDPTVNNPCVDYWQGIKCSFSSPFEFYNVEKIALPSYNLVGTIPPTIDGLSQLQYIDLSTNQLSGTITTMLGNLLQLQYLDLDSNQLTGTIPESLGNPLQFQSLVLYSNQLTGTIPWSLGQLLNMKVLDLDTNQLNGTVPESLGNLTDLLYLDFDTNQLTGTIPDSLGNLTFLQYLDVSINQLSGTIPESLGKLKQLNVSALFSNTLTGTIPQSLGDLPMLQYFRFCSNRLSGTIPHSLGNLTTLRSLLLYENLLTGTLPESLGNLVQIVDLLIYFNQFTGTIPASLGNLLQLQFLELHTNELSGTIPNIASTALMQLQLFNNNLLGKVPSLQQMLSLQVVLLHNNYLTGSLVDVFDSSNQLLVETIVVSSNQLTGTIPMTIFQLKPNTFVATSNCFEGPLPIFAVCRNLNMVSFVIDGMGSASTCRNKLFVGPLSAYSLKHAIGGSLPTCLFKLPNISTLHLSGNGLTGSIPSDIVLSDSLTDLALSHNILTGSIPQQMQLHNWKNIDISYNRLSGTLSSDFASNLSVAVDNNRISGRIPPVFHSVTNISILGSNTFTCDYEQKNLPEHDPNREHYHCGSNTFDVLFYIWIGSSVIVSGIVGYQYRTNSMQSNVGALHNTNLSFTLIMVCRLSLWSTMFSIVVLLPLYAICSVLYSTQNYTYAYLISAAYKSGVVPFALFWGLWWTILISTMLFLRHARTISTTNGSIFTTNTHQSTLWQTILIVLPFLVLDFVIVSGVNAAYVYVAVYQSRSLLFIAQTLLSIFKVMWGRWALPYTWKVLTQQRKSGQMQVLTQILVTMINNILIPVLIVGVVSPNCFFNALVAAPEVTATVYYTECELFDFFGHCVRYGGDNSLSTSFAPPFVYNYQCSSSLITYYSPAFVSMCIVSTFGTPLMQYMCQWLHSRATFGTHWYKLLDRCLPRLLKRMDYSTEVSENGYLNIDGLVTTLVSTLALILTFGVMFPPLCVAFTLSICGTVFLFRHNVRILMSTTAEQRFETTKEILRAECDRADAMHILKGSVWLLITVSCWFYTLFLFDTLGDAVGFERAYWVLIVMPLMPLFLYILNTAVRKYYGAPHSHKPKEAVSQTKAEVEMQAIATSATEMVHNILVLESPFNISCGAVKEI